MTSPSNNNATQVFCAVAAAVGVTLVGAKFASQEWKRSQQDLVSKSLDIGDIPSELLTSKYADELQLAVKLAIQAGTNMMQYCETRGVVKDTNEADESLTLEISTKGNDADFCTQVDVENERLVMKGIKTNFPTHLLIGEEESSLNGIPTLTEEPTWIIDPIDGTTNFASAIPLTCVSIGFCHNKHPVMGVIYAPLTKELYMAVHGHGAYRNGKRIVNHRDAKNQVALNHAVVGFEFGYARDKDEVKAMVNAVERVLLHGCRAMRQMGSGCLDLCYVASGRLDVVYSGVASEGWKPWDYAAGSVICNEAGCVMESLHPQEGSEFDLYSKSILCAVNRDLLEACRKVVLDL